jgi:WD40 repeat protein
MQTLAGHSHGVTSLTFAADGRYLVSCAGRERRVSVWNLATGRRDFLSGHSDTVENVAAPPCGSQLATEANGVLRLWSLAQGVPKSPTVITGGHLPVYNADGSTLACIHYVSGQVNQCEIRFDQGDVTIFVERVRQPYHEVRATAWSRDGHTFAVALFAPTGFHAGRVYRFHPDQDGALGEPINISTTPLALALSPDGRYLAVSANSRFHLFDAVTDPTFSHPVEHDLWCWDMAFLPDGRLLTCSSDGHTRLWDAASGKVLDERHWELRSLTALAVAGDGMRAAIADDHGHILIFDLD